MRFQINEHPVKLKVRIDEIALAMIDRTKKSEEMYLKNIKGQETFSEPSSFDDAK
jgi:hypothetical protein